MPEVSIAVPTYNGALYIKECLRSAMAQTFTDLEIVVVDDCSSDRTWAIAESMAARDGRIRMVRNPCRLGLVQNWNRSICHCTGKWIKFLFQDDLLHEHCIERMLSAANADQNSTPKAFVVGDRDFLIEDGVANHLRLFYESSVVTLKDIFQKRSFIGPEALSKAIIERGVGLNFVGEPTSVMVKREMFTKYSFLTNI
ncbi:MAG: glycosyltransferase family 2 protein [Deltaproteobacteria bacterium]|nr:glycosyltransferase family 2 protein [Deltaproteobacteria bacterium]